MIARDDALKLLEGLDYFTQNKVSSWKGMPRGAFLYSLTQIFLTENLSEIRNYLSEIINGQILPNIIPQEIYEKAQKQGIPQKSLEQSVQKQRSHIQSWLKSIKEKPNAEQVIETQVEAAKAAAKIEKESAAIQPEIKTEKREVETQSQKGKSVEEVLPKEEILIPVTGTEKIVKEVPIGEKLQNIQIIFDTKETGNVKERLNVTQPFWAASAKVKQSELIDLNPSLNLISKGISSEKLRKASVPLPEGREKESISRIAYTMGEIERVFPNEISQIKNFISVDNLQVQISKIDFIPTPNKILMSPNINSFGGYTAIDGISGFDTIADFAKDQVLDKASDAVLSKVKTEIGGKLAKGALGKAVSSLGAKLSSTGLGKVFSTIGSKIVTAIASIGGPLGTLVALVANAIASWIIEKLRPLLKKAADTTKKAALGAAGVAATIILLPITLFISSITLPFIIILITLPISVALIMFIINSGAYIVPPKLSTLTASGIISPYIDLTKTANPPGPFENTNLPMEIEYTVEIKAKKSGLTNIRIEDKCNVVKEGVIPSCPQANPSIESIQIPETITVSKPFSFVYKRSFDTNFKDTLTIDVVTVTADVPEKKDATATISLAVRIGNPPDECPYNAWPLANNAGINNVTQGPFASGPKCTHFNMLAEAMDVGVLGAAVIAVNSGIAEVNNDISGVYGKYVDIRSNCGESEFESRYAHLNDVFVRNGDRVILGQTIGISGNTGVPTTGDRYGPHLHFDFRSPSNGRVNPPTLGKPYLARDIPTGCGCNFPCQ